MAITDIEQNPWTAASTTASSGTVSDVSHNPWQQPNVGIDVAKAVGTEAAKAGIAQLGQIGDIGNLGSQLGAWIAQKTGLATPEAAQRATEKAAQLNRFPTTQ